jgi:decaprenylphospho-beta-D-ribofuranose 2-oxidase
MTTHHRHSRAKHRSGLSRVGNWGNYPVVLARLHSFEEVEEAQSLLGWLEATIPRGNGRCYGDSALAGDIISTLRHNKFLAFDDKNGRLCCQAGVTLAEVLEVIVPRGWFLPVTPGTKFITVGGAIASDVHGKNQHKDGTFGDHVARMELLLGDGSVASCSRDENPELFRSACGGMGLTGLILNATFRLKPIETAYIREETIRAANLDDLMDLFEASETWTHSMAWIDCLARGRSMGRGILMRGEHARREELETEAQRRRPLTIQSKRQFDVPFNFPDFALNRLTMTAFNLVYYNHHPARPARRLVDYDSFFYPLDAITNWNRIYGKRGFTQYQFILPRATGRSGLATLLRAIADSGAGSFLAVLKLYGPQRGYIPFAMEGYSLALDFPITAGLFDLLDELDKLVLAYGGRLYLTKDARMSREMFLSSYPRAETFIQKVRQFDPHAKFRSFQSDRVGITQ